MRYLFASRRNATLFVLFFGFWGSLTAQESQIVLLNGDTISGSVEAIGSDGKIAGEKLPASLEIDELRRITRPVSNVDSSDPYEFVRLPGGGQIKVSQITIGDETCHVSWRWGDGFDLSIDDVSAIQFVPKQSSDEFQNALGTPSAEFDRIFVKVEEKIQRLTGLIDELNDKQIAFEWKGRAQTLPRANLFGVVLADVGGVASNRRLSVVQLRDGSTLPGDIQLLKDNILHVKTAFGSLVKLPWEAVQSIQVQSSRLAFLSDLKAVEEKQQTIVTLSRPWQRDRNVSGQPLVLRDEEGKSRVYEKGIGTHSRSELTFDVGGRFDRFSAAIGIDAGTGGRGNCIFVILADGEQLFSQQIKGTDAARNIELAVKDVKRLTLVVEPGEELDLADHANWCDARLIRNTSGSN